MHTRHMNGKDQVLIFRRSIEKNGKTIYPKKGKAFPIWVDVESLK